MRMSGRRDLSAPSIEYFLVKDDERRYAWERRVTRQDLTTTRPQEQDYCTIYCQSAFQQVAWTLL
jgi:hypothetical protein